MKPTTRAAASLASWLQEMPGETQFLKVSTRAGMGAQQVLLELPVAELAGEKPVAFAERILRQCESWSDTVNRECLFVAQFLLDQDKPTSTIQFRVGPINGDAMPIDGSCESWILQLQATLHQKDRLILDMMKTAGEAYQRIIETLTERLGALESNRATVEKLREQLVAERAEITAGTEAGSNAKFDRLLGVAEKLLTAEISRQNTGKPPNAG